MKVAIHMGQNHNEHGSVQEYELRGNSKNFPRAQGNWCEVMSVQIGNTTLTVSCVMYTIKTVESGTFRFCGREVIQHSDFFGLSQVQRHDRED